MTSTPHMLTLFAASLLLATTTFAASARGGVNSPVITPPAVAQTPVVPPPPVVTTPTPPTAAPTFSQVTVCDETDQGLCCTAQPTGLGDEPVTLRLDTAYTCDSEGTHVSLTISAVSTAVAPVQGELPDTGITVCTNPPPSGLCPAQGVTAQQAQIVVQQGPAVKSSLSVVLP